MSNTFLISDTHFSHANILTFLNPDGTRLRPFNSVEEMDELMIENWNKVVKPQDKVYHLGDVCFKFAHLQATMPRLNGTKVLIKGNHDELKPSQYLQYFKDIRAYSILDKFILSHIPIHRESLSRWKANIHGHLHQNVVKCIDGLPDKRYINVSVEQINFTPIPFETIRSRYTQNQPSSRT